jgi:hypothetical protein
MLAKESVRNLLPQDANASGIARSSRPTRVSSMRGRCPLGCVAGVELCSPGSAPMEAVASASIRRCDVCSSPQEVKQAAPGCRVVAITFRSPIRPARIEGPHLGIIYSARPDTLFWEPGGLPMPLPPEHTILKDYPVRCERLSEDWHLAALAFGRDFPRLASRWARTAGRPVRP